MKNRFLIHTVLLICCLSLNLTGCRKAEVKPAAGLQVVTSLFPLYDFARTIAGDKASVTLLLPPGMEPHTFEPKPEDMIRIAKSGLFIYTGPHMEPWADRVIKGIDNKALRVVEAGKLVAYRAAASDDDHHESKNGKHHEHAVMDPHIWLDFTNAASLVDAILEGFNSADPANSDLYRKNAVALKGRLTALDARFTEALASCDTRHFLHGGHYTFGYLARRYKLDYHALSGVSSDSEPSAVRMASIIRQIRASGVKYMFAEELLSPRLAETLAREAGVQLLTLHGAHNLSRDEFSRGITFFDLMNTNLERLQKGLQCRAK
ncbi:MAG: zinc ABC transporter substrate-binding protein [Deltaproteobacteria bacterium]|nr:zinc ABC transporter substrate-binding protein [Deltaproteobacteria bacterium]